MEWADTSGQFSRYLLTSGKSPGTVRTYLTNLSVFWRDCARYECVPHQADRYIVRTWISDRLAVVSTARAHNDLAALRLFYKWLRETRYRDDDPTENIRVKRAKSLPTKPLQGQEVTSMVEVCTDERDRLLLLVLCHTGIRISELASLQAESIDWQRGVIKIRGKGNKERLIAPSPDVLGRLHSYCGMFPTGPLWLSKRRQQPLSAQQIRKIIYGIAERAKIDGVHPHRFRSTFATEYIEQFGDIQALQGVMGHDSIETTSRYSEWTRERRGLEQMKKLRFG